MSEGIIITAKDEKPEIKGYYQNFAEEFNDFAHFLKEDGCDLNPYLYCPNSIETEEDIRDYFEYDEDVTEEKINEVIAYNKLITTEAYYPISKVVADLLKARTIADSYGEERFHHGKDALLSDLDEVIQSLDDIKDTGIEILLFRC